MSSIHLNFNSNWKSLRVTQVSWIDKDNEKKKRFNSRRKSFDRVARQFKNKLRSRLNRLDLNYEKRRFHSLQHNFRSHPNGTNLFTKQELKNDWDISRGHHTNSDSGGSDRTVVWPSIRSEALSVPMFWRFRFSLEMRAAAAGVTEPSFDHQYGRRPCRCRCFDGFDFPWKWERQRREWQNRRLTINTVGGPVDADVLTVSIFLGNESGSGGSDRTVVWPSIRSEALSVPMFWRFRFSLEMRAAAAGVTEPSFDHQRSEALSVPMFWRFTFSLEMRAAAAGVTEPSFDHQYGRRPSRCRCFDGFDFPWKWERQRREWQNRRLTINTVGGPVGADVLTVSIFLGNESDSGGSDRTVVWPSIRSEALSMPMFWRFRFSLEMRAAAAGVTEPSFDHQYGRRPCRCWFFDGLWEYRWGDTWNWRKTCSILSN